MMSLLSLKTRLVYKFLPTLLSSIKLLHRVGATPVFLTVTDISPGAGLYTDPIPALSYLQSQVRFLCRKYMHTTDTNIRVIQG